MTSAELKHRAKLQEWSARIQDCRKQRPVSAGQVSRNVAERSATLHIGNASLDIYPGCDAEQLRLLVELLRLC